MLEFEWNNIKATINLKKHGVSFFDACEVFDDEHSLTVRDPDHSDIEERYLIFGLSKENKYLVVSFTERSDRIRIISAREMTGPEQKAYEQ